MASIPIFSYQRHFNGDEDIGYRGDSKEGIVI